MATSGTYEFSMTARDVVAHALQELKVLAVGTDPSAAELTSGLLNLNLMLKSWQIEDSVWREVIDEEVTVSADTASAELPEGVRNVTDARLVVSATYHRPMQPWTQADYQQIPNKTTTGTPLAYWVRKERGTAVLYVWPVPSTDTDLLVDYVRGIETVTEATETLDVPDDWLEAVWTNLALRLAGAYEAEIPDELAMRAGRLYQQLQDEDRPDSYFMGPWDDRYYG